jgi:hypothetical protein
MIQNPENTTFLLFFLPSQSAALTGVFKERQSADIACHRNPW